MDKNMKFFVPSHGKRVLISEILLVVAGNAAISNQYTLSKPALYAQVHLLHEDIKFDFHNPIW